MELEGMDCNCAMSGANRALLSSSKGSDGNPEARNKKKMKLYHKKNFK